jgi:subtilisin
VGQYIVVLKAGADRAAAASYARSLGGEVFMQYQYALNGFAVRLPADARADIERNPRVLFISQDGEVHATSSCDPLVVQCLPTGIDRVDAERSSARSGDGRGFVDVNVAVLDTGIYANHPDLNVVGGTKNCGSSQNIDDSNGHGSSVAGIVAAKDNGFGAVGVAPGARLWSVQVLDSHGKGSISQEICGIDWVTSTRMDADPMNDIAVANESLVGPGSDDGNCGRTNKDAEHLAICNSVASGVTYVVGAGNAGVDFQNATPAAFNEVLTATAMTDLDGQPGGSSSSNCFPAYPFVDDAAAFFSNFATLASDQGHTVAAPGVCLLTTGSPDGIDYGLGPPSLYQSNFTGTSAAAPHVAGLVALCIASGPCAGLRPAQIIKKIANDAAAYSTKHRDYGFSGDPLRPATGKYYGYLIRAALY